MELLVTSWSVVLAKAPTVIFLLCSQLYVSDIENVGGYALMCISVFQAPNFLFLTGRSATAPFWLCHNQWSWKRMGLVWYLDDHVRVSFSSSFFLLLWMPFIWWHFEFWRSCYAYLILFFFYKFQCLLSFWRLFIGGCSLSTFLHWSSWVRCMFHLITVILIVWTV